MKRQEQTSISAKLLIAALLQAILYSGLWLWNEYVASYITIIFPFVMLVILVLAAIADWIEPSRIPKWYYWLMAISIVTPLLIGGAFYMIYEGRLEWLI